MSGLDYMQFVFDESGKCVSPGRIRLLKEVNTFVREEALAAVRDLAVMQPLPKRGSVFFIKVDGDGWLFDLSEI